jgi:hypothetical protein
VTAVPPDELLERIEGLDDRRAVAVLAAVLEHQGFQVESVATHETQAQVDEALHQPELADYATTSNTATAGDIARLTLAELARRDPNSAADITRAMALPAVGEKFDPLTLAIGALVLFAFHADIKLEKDPKKGWSFRFATKPLKDSTIGKILGGLFKLGG